MPKTKTEAAQSSAKWWLIVLLLAIVSGGSICFAVSQSSSYCKASDWPASLGQNPTKTPETAEEVTAAVGRLILLSPEKPKLAVIDDKVEELKAKDPFFKNAQMGDRILVYSDRAIIYRPSENIIVNVGSISVVEGEENR